MQRAAMPTVAYISNSTCAKIGTIETQLTEMDKALDELFSRLIPITLQRDPHAVMMTDEIKQSPSSDMFRRLSDAETTLDILISRVRREIESLEI